VFDHYSNIYARWIRVVAIATIVVGVFVAFLIWMQDFEDLFVSFIMIVLSTVISGLLMYGFAEMIEMLYRIYQRFEMAVPTNQNRTTPDSDHHNQQFPPV